MAGRFHAINVFVGPEHAAVAMQGNLTAVDHSWQADSPSTWHSQCGQDFIVAAIFQGARDFFFVDLAANHPIRYSNSRSLERDFGWRGLCIEPNPTLLWQLAQRRTCTVVGAVVSDSEDGSLNFMIGKGSAGHNSPMDHVFSKIISAEEAAAQGEGVIRLTPATLRSVLQSQNAPRVMSYLSLDVERHEDAALLPVLEHEPPEYTWHVMTIEGPSVRLQGALRRAGYTCALPKIGVASDQLWVHASVPGGVANATMRADAANKAWHHKVRWRSNPGMDATQIRFPRVHGAPPRS